MKITFLLTICLAILAVFVRKYILFHFFQLINQLKNIFSKVTGAPAQKGPAVLIKLAKQNKSKEQNYVPPGLDLPPGVTLPSHISFPKGYTFSDEQLQEISELTIDIN